MHLHRAVNQIRGVRANLETLEKWTSRRSPKNDVISAAKALDQKMTPVEESLIQVKMKSSEGNLRYPNMLNEQYASFNDLIQIRRPDPYSATTAGVRGATYSPHRAVGKVAADSDRRFPALNDLMRKNGVPTLSVGNGQGE